MVKRCCVFNCNGSYDDNNKVKVFRLPKDPKERKKWTDAIPRDNIPESHDTVICERHWPSNYPTFKHYGKLRPTNPPSVFSCVLSSLLPHAPAPPRSTKMVTMAARTQLQDEMQSFNKLDKISNFEELKRDISINQASFLFTIELVSFEVDDILVVQSKKFVEDTGITKFALHIFNDLSYEGFHSGVKSCIPSLSFNRCCKILRWSQFQEAIRFLRCKETSHQQSIILEQIKAMNTTTVTKPTYSPESIVRSFEYFSLSRSAYNRLRHDFKLPSTKTLTRLTSATRSLDTSVFIQKLFSSLSDCR